MVSFKGVIIFNCTKQACTELRNNEDKLNDLDRAAGDGDTGTTLSRGANGKLFHEKMTWTIKSSPSVWFFLLVMIPLYLSSLFSCLEIIIA